MVFMKLNPFLPAWIAHGFVLSIANKVLLLGKLDIDAPGQPSIFSNLHDIPDHISHALAVMLLKSIKLLLLPPCQIGRSMHVNFASGVVGPCVRAKCPY